MQRIDESKISISFEWRMIYWRSPRFHSAALLMALSERVYRFYLAKYIHIFTCFPFRIGT